jgi:hypothetical protein
MSFVEIMHAYFRGEKLEALAFILPTGVVLVALAAVALKVERGGFAWGVAVPCALFGLVLIGTGVGVGARTAGQVAALEHSYREAPAVMIGKELPRMQKVNTNFRITFFALGVLAAIGLALHYLGGAGWGRGLGSVLILAGAVGLLIDGFAERRAVPYTAALEELAAQHGVGDAHSP